MGYVVGRPTRALRLSSLRWPAWSNRFGKLVFGHPIFRRRSRFDLNNISFLVAIQAVRVLAAVLRRTKTDAANVPSQLNRC